ncbi:MAG: arginyl-tRNA synthetase, partial [Chlamydiota bacterium]
MDLLLIQLRDLLTDAIRKECNIEATAEVAICQEESFGHYQCNSALSLAKALKTSPRSIAEKIATGIQCHPWFAKVEIAGPGFINMFLSESFLSQELQTQLHDPLLGATPPSTPQRIIVEFSSPNVAKELHVGHLRSTIIGDSLARLFEFLGHHVIRLNHIGDWGTQFGMLIAYLTDPDHQVELTSDTSLETLMGWYRKAKARFDQDPLFKKRSQLEVVKLQSGDPQSVVYWQQICDTSRKGFQEIYSLLSVHLIERGESFYNPYLKDVVDELDQKGLITISDGAKCIFLEGFKNREGEPLPIMVQKSDGGYNYDTTDLAALRYRITEDRAERIIIVTDIGQSLHFQLVFATAAKAGWLRDHLRLDHVGFGLVLGPDGKKFKTRSGDTEKLIDLLTEAVDRAGLILKERESSLSEEEQKNLARVLGIAALKYAD